MWLKQEGELLSLHDRIAVKISGFVSVSCLSDCYGSGSYLLAKCGVVTIWDEERASFIKNLPSPFCLHVLPAPAVRAGMAVVSVLRPGVQPWLPVLAPMPRNQFCSPLDSAMLGKSLVKCGPLLTVSRLAPSRRLLGRRCRVQMRMKRNKIARK